MRFHLLFSAILFLVSVSGCLSEKNLGELPETDETTEGDVSEPPDEVAYLTVTDTTNTSWSGSITGYEAVRITLVHDAGSRCSIEARSVFSTGSTGLVAASVWSLLPADRHHSSFIEASAQVRIAANGDATSTSDGSNTAGSHGINWSDEVGRESEFVTFAKRGDGSARHDVSISCSGNVAVMETQVATDAASWSTTSAHGTTAQVDTFVVSASDCVEFDASNDFFLLGEIGSSSTGSLRLENRDAEWLFLPVMEVDQVAYSSGPGMVSACIDVATSSYSWFLLMDMMPDAEATSTE